MWFKEKFTFLRRERLKFLRRKTTVVSHLSEPTRPQKRLNDAYFILRKPKFTSIFIGRSDVGQQRIWSSLYESKTQNQASHDSKFLRCCLILRIIDNNEKNWEFCASRRLWSRMFDQQAVICSFDKQPLTLLKMVTTKLGSHEPMTPFDSLRLTGERLGEERYLLRQWTKKVESTSLEEFDIFVCFQHQWSGF